MRFVYDLLTARRRERGTRRRRLTADRRALLTLPRLRCAHTYARLGAGFGVDVPTVYRYIAEAVEVLAPPLRTGPRPSAQRPARLS